MFTRSLTAALVFVTIAAFVASQCTKTTYVTTPGTACGGTTGNECVPELFCNTTSKVCQLEPLAGAACTSDDGCKNSHYDMLCLNNVCTVAYKIAGASCTLNGECASNNCTSNACVAMKVGSPCKAASSCGTPDYTLFCNSNLTCSATVAEGGACGMIGGGIFTQCLPALACVGNGTNGTCQNSVGEGATCSSFPSVTTNIFSAPLCMIKDKPLTCLGNNKCGVPYTIPAGQACGTTAIIDARGSCDPATSACVNNICTTYRNITCQSNTVCQGGLCDCPNTSINGTCAISPLFSSSCAIEGARMLECTQLLNTQKQLGICAGVVKAYRS